jgi:predicted GIY-YIG superfamily endonuclease
MPNNPWSFPASGPGHVRADRAAMSHHDDPRRCVYIIRSVRDPERQYIGRTADVASRLASHNAGESPRTARQAPWQIVVLMQFVEERRALDFEKFLKSSSGRAFVKQYFG